LTPHTAHALRRHGFQIVVVKNGEHALHYWKQSAPDLVLADLELPALDGLKLCREIRQQGAMHVIIASGRTRDEDVVRAFELAPTTSSANHSTCVSWRCASTPL
jgi:DNA-binding response OmpR family regulator